MLDNTLSGYIFIRACILLLHPIGPVCLTYTAWSLSGLPTHYENHKLLPTHPLLQIWCAAEAAFYLFFLWYRVHLQREAVHPPIKSRDDRRALLEKVRGAVHSPERFLSGWFKGAKFEDIGREEVKHFVNWTFFEGRATSNENDEVEEYTREMEQMIGRAFKPGEGTAKSLRLTLDPIEMECRSLFWYGCMMIVDHLTFALMPYIGFQYCRTPFASPWVFPPRPGSLSATKISPAKGLSYWYRPHTSKTRLPVLSIHGIGVGLISHFNFLGELDQALNGGNGGEKDDGQVGILALETLSISMRIVHPIMNRETFIEELTQVLDAHGYDRFILLSHSYGSVLSAHILTHEPLAARVSSTMFIDPVTFLLYMPDVAYNFTVRKPRHTNEWQLWYFASKDPGVAHVLGRHFFWFENVLWRDRLVELGKRGLRVTACLGSRDLIVDTHAVAKYLLNDESPDPVLVSESVDANKHMELETKASAKDKHDAWKSRQWQGEGIEVIWFEGLDHGQVFDAKASRKRLVDVVCEYSKGS